MRFIGVAQFVAVTTENLDAVVLDRIVRRADDDAGRGADVACDCGDAGGRHDPDGQGVAPGGGDPGNECRFQHRSGQPRIASNDDRQFRRNVVGERKCCGAPDAQSQFRREVGVGNAAYAVGPEASRH